MQFFIPQASRSDAEGSYQSIKTTIFQQFRLPIQDRRIFKLSYTNSKKKWQAEVGQLEWQENRYQILAIFESKQFIIFTRTQQGSAGPVILVNKDEVTAIEDFDLSVQ